MSDLIDEAQQELEKAEKRVSDPMNWALIGGSMVAIFTLGGLLIGGHVYSNRTALEFIGAMSPPLQMLGFATITATITMLALILTMLGLVKQAELGFSKKFYLLIERLSLLDTVLLIGSTMLLTVLAIPVTKAETDISQQSATILYYILIFANAVISGLLVASVLMLFDAIKSIIRTITIQKNDSE
jgi:hypothetical protein